MYEGFWNAKKRVNIIEYTLIKNVCRSNINVSQLLNGFIKCLSQNTVNITHGITFNYSTVCSYSSDVIHKHFVAVGG